MSLPKPRVPFGFCMSLRPGALHLIVSYLDSFLFNILVEWRTLSLFPLLGGVLLNAEVLAKRNPDLNKGVGITSEILVFNAWFV